ncbi:MAG: S4 domain-containing protein [Pseudomonadota bacterium]
MNSSPDGPADLRVDRWLWTARFFKSRALASEAVNGGKVHVNGARVKPARPVRVGDQLRIQRGSFEFTVDVLGINSTRRPASEARQLYRETEASVAKREALAARLREDRVAHGGFEGPKPDKRQRRHIVRFRRQQDNDE